MHVWSCVHNLIFFKDDARGDPWWERWEVYLEVWYCLLRLSQVWHFILVLFMDEYLYFWLGKFSLCVFCMLARCCCLLVGIHDKRRFFVVLWLIFLCQGSRFSHMVSFYLIKNIYCFLRFKFGWSGFPADYVVDNNILNMTFKVCVSLERCLSCSMIFDENWFVVLFITLESFERRSVSEVILTSPFQNIFDSINLLT